jgi:hypothetical protein
MAQELRFEDLIGKTVRNSFGRPIGRIVDARIEPAGEDYLVTHFLLGTLGRLHRLRAFLGELPTLRVLGIGHERDLRPLPWHWFDLSDPDRPVLTTSGEKQRGSVAENRPVAAEKKDG